MIVTTLSTEYNGTQDPNITFFTSADDLNNNEFGELNSSGVIYSSYWEKWLCFFYILIAALLVFLANAFFIVEVLVFPRFHNIHHAVLVSYAVSDVLYSTTASLQFLLTWGYGAHLSELTCRLMSMISIGGFFNTIYHVGLVAFERFMYFCHPLKYPIVFTRRNLLLMVVALYIICYGYSVAMELLVKRTFSAAALMCLLETSSYQSIIQIIIFFVPSLSITIYGTYKTWKLANALRIAPALPPEHQQQQQQQQNPRSIHMAIRLVLLVAGVYWGTYFPAYIARSIINNTYTFPQLNFRQNPVASMAYRATLFVLCHFSSLSNPIIYFFTHKELRIGAMVLVRLRKDFPAAEDGTNNTATPNAD